MVTHKRMVQLHQILTSPQNSFTTEQNSKFPTILRQYFALHLKHVAAM